MKTLRYRIPILSIVLVLSLLAYLIISVAWDLSRLTNPVSPITETSSSESLDQNDLFSSLFTLLELHFAEDYNDPATHLSMLVNPEHYDRLIRLNSLFGLAIDLEMNLNGIERFGVEVLDNGAYRINHQNSPGWRTLDELLGELQVEDAANSRLFGSLTLRGMSQENITALNNYVTNTNPQLDIGLAALDILDREIAATEALNLAPDDREGYARRAQWINEQALWESGQILKIWALELMNQLDRTGQEILFSVVSEETAVSQIFPSPLELSIDGLIEEINTGRLRALYQQHVEQFN